MTTAELLTRSLYSSLRRSPENKHELDKLGLRMMEQHRALMDQRELLRRKLRGRSE